MTRHNYYHVQPSSKQLDWVDEYKKDPDTNLIMNYLSMHQTAAPPEIINNVDKCYC